jgi:hypothetical protein
MDPGDADDIVDQFIQLAVVAGKMHFHERPSPPREKTAPREPDLNCHRIGEFKR